MDRMWRLAEFQYDDLIPDGEVAVLDDSLGDELVYLLELTRFGGRVGCFGQAAECWVFS